MQINNEARRGGTDRQTHTHKNDYRNPPAHVPRVNNTIQNMILLDTALLLALHGYVEMLFYVC